MSLDENKWNTEWRKHEFESELKKYIWDWKSEWHELYTCKQGK